MKITNNSKLIVLISSIIFYKVVQKLQTIRQWLSHAGTSSLYRYHFSCYNLSGISNLFGRKNNVEIRSQVDGYLDRIYVEEGAYVRAGQPLFKIDPRVYGEQMNMALLIFRLPMPIFKKQK
jgi:membrane fusion protein (multidrug efflux system)